MTREEAIEFIAQSVKSDVDMAKVADALKALEQELIKNHLGVDCISREQALVTIRNLYPGMPRVDFNGSLRKWVDKYKPYIECEDAIEELPSVTSQEPKWIPVSERLPEENKTVIASTKYGVYSEARYTKEDGWEWAYESGADYWVELEYVTAWMPLPESYKGENEGR